MGQSNYPWPALRIAPAQVEQCVQPVDGQWVWNGTIEIPENECTVDSNGVRISVSLDYR